MMYNLKKIFQIGLSTLIILVLSTNLTLNLYGSSNLYADNETNDATEQVQQSGNGGNIEVPGLAKEQIIDQSIRSVVFENNETKEKNNTQLVLH